MPGSGSLDSSSHWWSNDIEGSSRGNCKGWTGWEGGLLTLVSYLLHWKSSVFSLQHIPPGTLVLGKLQSSLPHYPRWLELLILTLQGTAALFPLLDHGEGAHDLAVHQALLHHMLSGLLFEHLAPPLFHDGYCLTGTQCTLSREQTEPGELEPGCWSHLSTFLCSVQITAFWLSRNWNKWKYCWNSLQVGTGKFQPADPLLICWC